MDSFTDTESEFLPSVPRLVTPTILTSSNKQLKMLNKTLTPEPGYKQIRRYSDTFHILVKLENVSNENYTC